MNHMIICIIFTPAGRVSQVIWINQPTNILLHFPYMMEPWQRFVYRSYSFLVIHEKGNDMLFSSLRNVSGQN